MNFRLSSALALVLVGALATGCSVTNVSTHASAFDHKDIAREDSNHHYTRHRERESYRTPKSDHASLKGDGSKAFLAAGQQNFLRQNYGLAEENFRKAVEQRTDSASAWLGLAASLDQLGKFQDADVAYRQVTELKANDARVLNNWGYSYLLRGDYSKARQYLNRAQNIDPTLEEIQGNIHLLEKTIES